MSLTMMVIIEIVQVVLFFHFDFPDCNVAKPVQVLLSFIMGSYLVCRMMFKALTGSDLFFFVYLVQVGACVFPVSAAIIIVQQEKREVKACGGTRKADHKIRMLCVQSGYFAGICDLDFLDTVVFQVMQKIVFFRAAHPAEIEDTQAWRLFGQIWMQKQGEEADVIFKCCGVKRLTEDVTDSHGNVGCGGTILKDCFLVRILHVNPVLHPDLRGCNLVLQAALEIERAGDGKAIVVLQGGNDLVKDRGDSGTYMIVWHAVVIFIKKTICPEIKRKIIHFSQGIIPD